MSNPIEEPVADSEQTSNENINSPQVRSYVAIKRLGIITAIVVPITVLPYLLARRQVTKLRRQVEGLQSIVRKLQAEYNSPARFSSLRDENSRMWSAIADVIQETEEMKALVTQREHTQGDAANRMKVEIERLMNGNATQRSQLASHDMAIKSFSTSLAQIAAFIHEADLSMLHLGMPSQRDRVENLRQAALRMQQQRESQEERKPNS